MGWIAALLLVALLLLTLWKLARFGRAELQWVGAAALVALAGYAWQGRPGLIGAPATIHIGAPRANAFAELRDEFMGEFTAASRWMIIAESYQRRGNTSEGVGAIRAGLRASPRNPDLWTALGNALMLHGGERLNPAADFAYRRALALVPTHAAARFFYGLALVREGRLDEARALWRSLLADATPGTSWRPLVEARLARLDQFMANSRP